MTTNEAKWTTMSPQLEDFIKAADHMKTMNTWTRCCSSLSSLPPTPTPWERQYDEARKALMESIAPVDFDPTTLIPTDR